MRFSIALVAKIAETLDNYEIECPWHGSRFDLRTGAVIEGPAGNPEPTYEVRIDGENILVRAK